MLRGSPDHFSGASRLETRRDDRRFLWFLGYFFFFFFFFFFFAGDVKIVWKPCGKSRDVNESAILR